MRYFPQLLTGAVAQYPLVRRVNLRTIVNEAADGGCTKFFDSTATRIEWELTLLGMSSAEAAALETLFRDSEGRLHAFVFADPTDNLLVWSEDFTRSVWVIEPMLEVSGGVSDPRGTSYAARLTNQSQALRAIEQSIASPGAYYYCFSLYVRGQEGGVVTLRRATATSWATEEFRLGPVWRRIYTTASLGAEESPVRFGILIPAGGSLELFGAQVEAQIGPSPYKRTTDRGGLYPESRFAEDDLTLTAQGPDRFSARLRIVSPYPG